MAGICFVLFYCLQRNDAKIQTTLQPACIEYAHSLAAPTLQHDTANKTGKQSPLGRPLSFTSGDNGRFVSEEIWSKVSLFVQATAQLAVPDPGFGRDSRPV